jgi:uridine phosphorylase
MGGPSAAIVLHELIVLGVRRAIRVGTCGALDGALGLGDLVVVGEAIASDGASRALGARERVSAHAGLTARLESSSGQAAVRIVSTDLFYDPDETRNAQWRAAGAIAVEMEAATLFTIGAQAEVPVACVLAVSDLLSEGRRERIEAERLIAAAERMGRVALAALTT